MLSHALQYRTIPHHTALYLAIPYHANATRDGIHTNTVESAHTDADDSSLTIAVTVDVPILLLLSSSL